MCGITGFCNNPEKWEQDIIRMNTRIAHRGPDASGVWSDPTHSVTLGHVRLSILDLSESGNQPMVSHDGRYVIVFNGEIYNHSDLSRRLLSENRVRALRGSSDTEILLEYIAAYGFERALKDSIGMFAIGCYDTMERRLYLGRDRIGEKPLYYGFIDGTFAFASEIGSLYSLNRSLEVDKDVLPLYFRYGYIPAPYSIYKGIRKLEAGCIAEISFPFKNLSVHSYWDIREVALNGQEHPFEGSEEEAADRLEELIKQSVSGQMVADVPVGAFLSGGIDSTAIVSVMQSLAHNKVKTFSIGFEDSSYNEAQYAKRTAEYLGTEHTELYVTSKDIVDVIPKLPYIYGEPFADSSQIPTYLVSSLARQHVTVSLSGDGGDELFCGYNVYANLQKAWSKAEKIPTQVRNLASHILSVFPFPHGSYPRRLSWYIRSKSIEDFYVRTMGAYVDIGNLLYIHASPRCKLDEYEAGFLEEPLENIMLMDLLVYHPDDILVKVDRSAMAVSLESRVPLLDKRVVEFAFSLPHSYKCDGKCTKKILRNVLHRYVPEEMMNRPKKGFSIPVLDWVRKGELKEWAESLLDKHILQSQGFLNTDYVMKVWDNFKNSSRNYPQIWYLLMFEQWLGFQKNNMVA